MKRARINPISANRDAKRQAAIDQHRDAAGMLLGDVRRIMRELVSDWPRVPDVDCPRVLADFRAERIGYSGFAGCWLCRQKARLDVCHIVPRSDARFNLLALCRTCHELTEKNWGMLPRILLVKLENDPHHTFFLGIALLRRKHFDFSTLDKESR